MKAANQKRDHVSRNGGVQSSDRKRVPPRVNCGAASKQPLHIDRHAKNTDDPTSTQRYHIEERPNHQRLDECSALSRP